MSETRISAGAATIGIGVDTPNKTDLEIVDIFTTHNGSWEPYAGDVYAVPQWARDRYLRPWGAADYFDDAGADHHLFARVEDEDGNPIESEIWFDHEGNWDRPVIRFSGDKKSGWANIPIWDCCWSWGPPGGPYVTGGGREHSASHHISVFAVWRRGAGVPPVYSDDFDRAFAWVLEREGSDLSTDPNDPGNYFRGKLIGTKYGISAASWGGQYDIPSLTEDQAREIYRVHYWQASYADGMEWPMSLLVFDTAVLHGVGTARRWLLDHGENAYAFAANRLHYYARSELWHYYGNGWVRRVADLMDVMAEG